MGGPRLNSYYDCLPIEKDPWNVKRKILKMQGKGQPDLSFAYFIQAGPKNSDTRSVNIPGASAGIECPIPCN